MWTSAVDGGIDSQSRRFNLASVTFVDTMLRLTAAPPVTRKREFWVLVGNAAALGVFGALASWLACCGG